MSLIGDIVNKIFHPSTANADTPQQGIPSSLAAPSEATNTQSGSQSTTPVDVDEVVSRMAKQHGEKLNWRTSIVDLLKALDLDSSLQARQKLAQELNYDGDTKDSATMNTWLQKQVLKKLGDNGGHVPPELLH